MPNTHTVQHTPGPWEAYNGHDRKLGSWAILAPSPVANRASTVICRTSDDSDIDLANARLCAAAPDLVDALITAVSTIEQLIPEPSARGVADVVLAQARAAIAKALVVSVSSIAEFYCDACGNVWTAHERHACPRCSSPRVVMNGAVTA